MLHQAGRDNPDDVPVSNPESCSRKKASMRSHICAADREDGGGSGDKKKGITVCSVCTRSRVQYEHPRDRYSAILWSRHQVCSAVRDVCAQNEHRFEHLMEREPEERRGSEMAR